MFDETAAQYVGVSRRCTHGALLRLASPTHSHLSVAWVNPRRGVWMVGLGVCGEGGGEVHVDRPLPAGPWFGGWGFEACRAWPGFEQSRWVLPEILAWWDGQHPWIAAFGSKGTSEAALHARIDSVFEAAPALGSPKATRMTAGREGYQDLVVRALSAIGSQRFSKVVLAREIEVESEAVFSERLILKALEARNADCWTFLVRGRDGSAFVGASPELLCESHQGLFATDALAGTGALGDERLLLESEKNRREHQSVVDDIRARLDRFVVRLELPEGPSVKHLANLVHLHTPIRATLREGVRALDVAKSLHPTAAVAGAPTGAALDWLRQNEGFSRGWYTGAVGAVGAEGLTLAVALRSALITGHRARVFVGAGVVQGSTPEGEWFETERKAATMLVALGVSDG